VIYMGFDPDYAKAIVTPSPNYWESRQGYKPDYIVMHGTDGLCPGAVSWLCDPQSAGSVHYVVGRDGTVWQLVPERCAAWGNGIPESPSTFVGGPNPNLFTISIEHERTGGNTTPITPEQQAVSTALVADIRSRWGHLPLIPHAAISPQSRAHCPGPGFPMTAIDQGGVLPAPHHTSGEAPATPRGTGARFLITRTTMARTGPSRSAVCWPLQWVSKGAVLEGTGRQRAHWTEVIAGGHPVWVWLGNCKPV
jgi:N-acetylmuramoyl-L-alanine amidase